METTISTGERFLESEGALVEVRCLEVEYSDIVGVQKAGISLRWLSIPLDSVLSSGWSDPTVPAAVAAAHLVP